MAVLVGIAQSAKGVGLIQRNGIRGFLKPKGKRMANLNHVVLIGNVTRDPELRTVGDKGSSVASFALAINQTSGKGENKRETTTFVEITCWGRPAETLCEYVSKGDPLMVEGRLKTDQWNDKATGEKRSKLTVVCERFQFLKQKSR